MSFLHIRVIINNNEIYTLFKDKPVIIAVSENHPKIVATDGFHISEPLELNYHRPGTYYLKVVCVIDNNLLITGIVLLLIFAIVGLISDIALFRFLSIVPILYFLFFYYGKKKEFLQIKITSEFL